MKIERKGCLWTSEDVADYTGLSINQVDALMLGGDIECMTVLNEKKLRTHKKAVDKWISRTLKIKIE